MQFPAIKNGFSLVEISVGLALLTITTLSFASVYIYMTQSDERVQFLRVLSAERSKVEAGIKNPTSWNLTLNSNTSMSCVFAPTGPASGCSVNSAAGSDGYFDFVLTDINGTKISFDPLDLTTRASARGGPCPAGIPANDPRCPIKYLAQWKPLCTTYPCSGPTFDIRVRLVLESPPVQATGINQNVYGMNMFRGIDENTVMEACKALNGTYNAINNTCFPKYKNQTCTSIGKPFQVVTQVAEDGTIDCSPLYKGSCNATTEVVSGYDALGNVICSPKVCSCQFTWGAWSPCSKACNDGTGPGSQIRDPVITASPTNGGTACPTTQTQSCNDVPCPINCSGVWSACSKACDDGLGPGSQTYSVTQAAQNGGLACPAADGQTQACNTQMCPVNCQGAWGICSKACDDGSGPGAQTYTISQPAANGGAACTNSTGDSQACNIQTCPIDCQGSWGLCGAGACGAGSEMYTVTTPAAGGLACPAANGDCRACAPPAFPPLATGPGSALRQQLGWCDISAAIPQTIALCTYPNIYTGSFRVQRDLTNPNVIYLTYYNPYSRLNGASSQFDASALQAPTIMTAGSTVLYSEGSFGYSSGGHDWINEVTFQVSFPTGQCISNVGSYTLRLTAINVNSDPPIPTDGQVSIHPLGGTMDIIVPCN